MPRSDLRSLQSCRVRHRVDAVVRGEPRAVGEAPQRTDGFEELLELRRNGFFKRELIDSEAGNAAQRRLRRDDIHLVELREKAVWSEKPWDALRWHKHRLSDRSHREGLLVS